MGIRNPRQTHPDEQIRDRSINVVRVRSAKHMSPEEVRKRFGDRIRTIRRQKGISQEDLALACDLDRAFVGTVERGQRNISLVNIYKIARGLNVPARELMP